MFQTWTIGTEAFFLSRESHRLFGKTKSLLFRVSVHYLFTKSLMVDDGNSNKFRKSCNKLKFILHHFDLCFSFIFETLQLCVDAVIHVYMDDNFVFSEKACCVHVI